MKIAELLKEGAEILSNSLKDINAMFESELLLSFVLEKERIYLALYRDEIIDDKTAGLFFSYIKRRAASEPISYITGTKEFMSLDFCVCPGVLIPRPDTETLICHIIDEFSGEGFNMLDLCTGSGAVCVPLAKYIKNTYVDAVDISDICIKTAKKNADENGVGKFINIIKADILNGFETDKKYDCIASNPPYIRSEDISYLMKDVRDFEPVLALDGGDDGLVFYEKISHLAPPLLNKNGMLAFEVGHDQAEIVKNIMIKNGFSCIRIIKDLAGINRVVSGRKI
ncbi:MAG: peptide chain release factor N(5)-glutamine methyltransferase [Ruminococcaceae bacterium]|nr:peptide chain release factor N(5)-glutamine methyltransferase [Oscillospiraceae bacterium]